jgi:hypothetical protein
LSYIGFIIFWLEPKNEYSKSLFHFFVLTQKNETKKSQDCACFAQKISARTAKSSKLATSLLKQGRFLTLFSLIFWLTRQGQLRVIKHIARPGAGLSQKYIFN